MSIPRVVVVGLGPAGPEYVTDHTRTEIQRVTRRFLRTTRHPSSSLVPDARSFDDLTATEKVGFAQKEISAELKQRLAKSKVFVNSRYGRWDVVTATVVALGNG